VEWPPTHDAQRVAAGLNGKAGDHRK
jgi:hypothetical protein